MVCTILVVSFCSPKTKLAVLDHVPSTNGLVLPIKVCQSYTCYKIDGYILFTCFSCVFPLFQELVAVCHKR